MGGRLWEGRKPQLLMKKADRFRRKLKNIKNQSVRKNKLILKKLKHWKGFKSMKEILVYHPEKNKIPSNKNQSMKRPSLSPRRNKNQVLT